MIITIAILS